MRRVFRVLVVVAVFYAVTLAQGAKVILLIGDGMGPGVVVLTKYYNDYVLKGRELNLVKLMNRPDSRVSMVTTHSASHLVTDSAAAATAFGTGHKTYNSAIGLDKDGKPVKLLTELAMEKGMMTGLITTCEIVDATPAGFSAQVTQRGDKEEIARQQLDRKINLLFGGGGRFFDKTDAKSKGYDVIYDKKDLKRVGKGKSDYALGLFNQREMNFVRERTRQEPSLPEMTRTALEFLSRSKDGFFLMVEGGRIDHAAHDNSPLNTIYDVSLIHISEPTRPY